MTEYKTVTMPMLDTGIGQSLGYEDDAAFLDARRAEREALDPLVREALEDHEKTLQRAVLGLP